MGGGRGTSEERQRHEGRRCQKNVKKRGFLFPLALVNAHERNAAPGLLKKRVESFVLHYFSFNRSEHPC